MWAFEGIIGTQPIPPHDETAKIDDTKVELPRSTHLLSTLFRSGSLIRDNRRQASPFLLQHSLLSSTLCLWIVEQTDKYYANDQELEDIVKLLRSVNVEQAYAAGCRNLQLDDCHGACWLTHAEFFYADQGGSLRRLRHCSEINNCVLDAAPADLTINTHVCRGESPQYLGLKAWLWRCGWHSSCSRKRFLLRIWWSSPAALSPWLLFQLVKVVLGLITTC